MGTLGAARTSGAVWPPAFVALASIVVLGTALASQYIGGLRPCELCFWQRYPYWATIALGVIGVAVARRSARFAAGLAAALVALAGLVFLVGAGIGFFHVGVEHHWWAGTSTCGAFDGGATSLDALRAQIMNTPLVRCDEPPFVLFGISMAGYNMLVSLALAAIAFVGARRMIASSRG